jgi:hypothetical protein
LIGLAAVLAGAALVVTACGTTAPKGTGAVGVAKDMRVVIVAVPEIPESAYAFKSGQVVRVKSTGVTVGTIESVQVTATLTAAATADGRLIAQPSPVSKEVRLVISGQAQARDGGYIFPGGQLYVTTDESFMTPTVLFRGAIVSIEPKAP